MRGEADDAAELLVALCSEQGFVGAFDERLVAATLAARADAAARGRRTRVILVGRRGALAAAAQGLAVEETLAMTTRAEEVPALATRLADTIDARLARGGCTRVTLVHARPSRVAGEVVTRRALVPFDPARFRARGSAAPPLTGAPPARLLAELGGEYLFAELCEALMLTHAAENAARVQAMERARINLERLVEEGAASYRLLCQRAITAEVAELASGRLAPRRR